MTSVDTLKQSGGDPVRHESSPSPDGANASRGVLGGGGLTGGSDGGARGGSGGGSGGEDGTGGEDGGGGGGKEGGVGGGDSGGGGDGGRANTWNPHAVHSE